MILRCFTTSHGHLAAIVLAAVLSVSAVAADAIEEVAASRWQWTGVAVTDDHRVFVNFPRWSDRMTWSVAALDESGRPRPFPDASWNDWAPGVPVDDQSFVAVQSVVRDAENTLWVLDTGNPSFEGVVEGAARLFRFDPASGRLLRTYTFEPPVIEPFSYLNDVRFDLEHGFAYLTDSGAGGLVVLDLESGAARRVLAEHPSTFSENIDIVIEGEIFRRNGARPQIHSDGIAYDAGRDRLYFQALTARTLYAIPAAALRDETLDDDALAAQLSPVLTHTAVDGLIADSRGRVYLSNLPEGAVDRFDPLRPDGPSERLAHDPRIAWPDSFSMTADGWLYFTTAQIHRGENPGDPYRIFRVHVGR